MTIKEGGMLNLAKGYNIELKIKDIDYSNDLRSIRLVSSINAPYQLLTLQISIDPGDLILDDVMEKEPLKLSIKLVGTNPTYDPLEHIQMELQCIKYDYGAQTKTKLSKELVIKDRTMVRVFTVCRAPFKTMTSMVNNVFLGKTTRQILEKLVSQTNTELIYDTDGENIEPIDQVVIPPTTLYNTIRYLEENFGLFDGPSNLGFCQYDNKLYIQNLRAKMNKAQAITINHLVLDSKNTNKIIEESVDGVSFYSYGNLINDYSGNAKLATVAKNVNYILKPKDRLYRISKKDTLEVCKDYGLNYQEPVYKYDSNLDNREVYNIEYSGYDVDNRNFDSFINTRIARQVSSFSTVRLALERNLRIKNLLRVGEPVKLNCGSEDYGPLRGKYILKSSDIYFKRDAAVWAVACMLSLMRTNQFI